MDYKHVPDMLRASARRRQDAPALTVTRDGVTRSISYADLVSRAERLAARFIELGVAAGDRIAIFAENSPEWTLVDLAILTAGAIPVPIFATNTPEQVRFLLQHSSSRFIFVGSGEQLRRVARIHEECPALIGGAVLDPQVAVPAEVAHVVKRLPDLEAGEATPEQLAAVQERLDGIGIDDLATIIYTSGTTGTPKGVMLSHRNILAELASLDELFDLQPGERNMCFLPLSHALERGWTWYILRNGMENCYVTDPRKVADEMVSIAPQTFVSVPRLFEKVYAVAHEQAGTGITRRIFDASFRVGHAAARRRAQGKRLTPWLAVAHAAADKLVLHRVRDAVGGDKRVLACGGAPLRREIEEFFHAAGITLYSGYGLTETAPLSTCNSPSAIRFGTVGRAISACELRIDDETGELCVKGDNVMLGYFDDPQATAEAIDADGWLHTGDVATIDEDGFVLITDRLKDILITAQGKNVAPAPIEAELEATEFIEAAVVLGDKRKYLTALLQPAFDKVEARARERGWQFTDRASLLEHPEVQNLFQNAIDEVGRPRARFERVQKFRLLPEALTMESGEMTPTLKIRRRIVEKAYAHLVDSMYESR